MSRACSPLRLLHQDKLHSPQLVRAPSPLHQQSHSPPTLPAVFPQRKGNMSNLTSFLLCKIWTIPSPETHLKIDCICYTSTTASKWTGNIAVCICFTLIALVMSWVRSTIRVFMYLCICFDFGRARHNPRIINRLSRPFYLSHLPAENLHLKLLHLNMVFYFYFYHLYYFYLSKCSTSPSTGSTTCTTPHSSTVLPPLLLQLLLFHLDTVFYIWTKIINMLLSDIYKNLHVLNTSVCAMNWGPLP